MSLSTFTCPMSHRCLNRIRVKEYDRMICGDLRENRKRWWKVRRTNQPAAPMSTSADESIPSQAGAEVERGPARPKGLWIALVRQAACLRGGLFFERGEGRLRCCKGGTGQPPTRHNGDAGLKQTIAFRRDSA